MGTRQACWIFVIATIAVTTLHPTVLATKAEDCKSTTLAWGRLGAIDASALKEEANEQLWRSMQETEGLSDIYVQSNVLARLKHRLALASWSEPDYCYCRNGYEL